MKAGSGKKEITLTHLDIMYEHELKARGITDRSETSFQKGIYRKELEEQGYTIIYPKAVSRQCWHKR
jgi:hypothetical protein